MRSPFAFVFISALSVLVFGCSELSPEEAAAEARTAAEDARVTAADADARVAAADAHVRVADAAVDAANADARVTEAADAAFGPGPVSIVIPSGTVFKVSLIDAVDSATSSGGDRFLASLSESIILNGATVLEKGTTLRGRVVDVEGAGRVTGRASIRLALTDIVQGERMVAITTDTFAASSDSNTTRDAKVVAGSAAVGAVIGAIAGGKKGVAVGAATGGGAGTGVVLATKGDEIHYGAETRFDFTLTNSVTL
jgi:hypothetical protein